MLVQKTEIGVLVKETGFKVLFVGLLLVVLVLSLLPISHPEVSPNDKVNHFIAYAVLAIAGVLAYRSKLWVSLFVINWGVFIELLQGMTEYRHYSMADAVANTAGVFIGIAAMVIWQRFIRQKKITEKPEQ